MIPSWEYYLQLFLICRNISSVRDDWRTTFLFCGDFVVNVREPYLYFTCEATFFFVDFPDGEMSWGWMWEGDNGGQTENRISQGLRSPKGMLAGVRRQCHALSTFWRFILGRRGCATVLSLVSSCSRSFSSPPPASLLSHNVMTCPQAPRAMTHIFERSVWFWCSSLGGLTCVGAGFLCSYGGFLFSPLVFSCICTLCVALAVRATGMLGCWCRSRFLMRSTILETVVAQGFGARISWRFMICLPCGSGVVLVVSV